MSNSKRKKILFFVSPFFGGASRITITIGKLLNKDEFEVKYVVFGKKIEDIKNFIPQGYDFQLMRIHNIWDFTTFKLVKLFKVENPYAVFGSFPALNPRLIVAAKMVGNIKVIARSNNNLSYFRWDHKLLMKLTYPYADFIITQQDEMKVDLENFIPSCKGKILSLQNPLDTETVECNLRADNPYKGDKETRFIWLGRVTYTKGHDILLSAFKKVRKSIPNAHLYILGKYSEEDKYYISLMDYIKQNDLRENVHFMGLIANPHIYVKHANCFVLPSRMEGLPNALVEALYIGTPVVASTCIPVIDRMVEEGVNGYKVPVGDTEKMAEAMIKALKLKDCVSAYRSAADVEFESLFR